MSLVSLEIQNTRVYKQICIEPSPHLNLVAGANASGKTTLLEAIHLLGTGRSFRTANIEQLRRNGSDGLNIIGKLQEKGGLNVRLGLIHGPEGRRMSVNGQEQKLVSCLAQHLPLHVISPDTHYEFQQSAKHRRGVLDWGLFHVEPVFSDLWVRYQRILKQRNAALKDRSQFRARYAWDDELIQAGEKLQAARSDLAEKLLPHFEFCCQALLGDKHRVKLVLSSGWGEELTFSESLSLDRVRDDAQGFTHSGPQRADLDIVLNGQTSKMSASHGQYKLLVIALRLAQVRFLLEITGRGCCVLIDDLAAELDFEHRARLSRFLAGLPIQVFVTTTELSLIDREYWQDHKTFHVEHGTITG